MSATAAIGSRAGLARGLVLALWPKPGFAQYEQPTLASLGQLSIEQLSNLTVTSVLRRPVAVGQAPASVYVITADDIMRSGAHSLPEVLRLAPNLDVAQLDAVSYAISARGFGGTANTNNKMLVLIDGRS
ncbi:MAG TPA: TonB-dependent receptor plug domain-containing protein, partial [Rhizomicrobium sp.]|nr:TonB-dependent receptor plug domain-containing protein [Rhizomicrobium sp.]